MSAKINIGKPLEWEIRYTDDEDTKPDNWYVNVMSENGYFDARYIANERWSYGGFYQTAAIVKVYWPWVMAGTLEDIIWELKEDIIHELEDRGCVEYNDFGSTFYVPPKQE